MIGWWLIFKFVDKLGVMESEWIGENDEICGTL